MIIRIFIENDVQLDLNYTALWFVSTLKLRPGLCVHEDYQEKEDVSSFLFFF